MDELCQKLPEGDPVHQTLETARKDYAEVQEEIDNTHQKLMQHPDKWKDYNARCSNFLFLKDVFFINQAASCIHYIPKEIMFEVRRGFGKGIVPTVSLLCSVLSSLSTDTSRTEMFSYKHLFIKS